VEAHLKISYKMTKIFRKALMMGLMLATASVGFAQEAKTADELKAESEKLKTELKSKETVEREKLQTELNSKETVERWEKIVKLLEKTLKETGVQSVDGLAKTAVGALIAVKSGNDVLSEYKREVADKGNGEIDITTHKAKLDDYVQLATNLTATSALIAAGTEQLKSAQDDAKKLSPLKAKPALQSVSFSTDALKLSAEEVALQVKLVNNLIATIKSAENL
jgi:CRISPR/Cas system-associated exonuclease Cas4 (RecB family)